MVWSLLYISVRLLVLFEDPSCKIQYHVCVCVLVRAEAFRKLESTRVLFYLHFTHRHMSRRRRRHAAPATRSSRRHLDAAIYSVCAFPGGFPHRLTHNSWQTATMQQHQQQQRHLQIMTQERPRENDDKTVEHTFSGKRQPNNGVHVRRCPQPFGPTRRTHIQTTHISEPRPQLRRLSGKADFVPRRVMRMSAHFHLLPYFRTHKVV